MLKRDVPGALRRVSTTMNEDMLGELAIEEACKKRFGVQLDITEVIARGVPTGIASQATVFKTKGGQIYAFIISHTPQLLDDVQKILHRMQCEADLILPPRGDAEYFDRLAHEKFKVMFPGKPVNGEDDLRYYKRLAPYNPALVRLGKVKGEIRGYERQSKTWRKVMDYAYSRISPK